MTAAVVVMPVMPVMPAEVAMVAVVATLEAFMAFVPARFAGKCRCCCEQARDCDDSQNAFHGFSPVLPRLTGGRG
jgi:hypothetical protein